MLQIHTKPLTNSKENQASDNNKRKSQVFPVNFDLKREVKRKGRGERRAKNIVSKNLDMSFGPKREATVTR